MCKNPHGFSQFLEHLTEVRREFQGASIKRGEMIGVRTSKQVVISAGYHVDNCDESL
jgi:hypothetical protein